MVLKDGSEDDRCVFLFGSAKVLLEYNIEHPIEIVAFLARGRYGLSSGQAGILCLVDATWFSFSSQNRTISSKFSPPHSVPAKGPAKISGSGK